MEDTNLSIKIFDDIYDAELKAAWIKLQHENDVFPQMYYEWIEPWIRLRFGKRKLYIISVIKNNEIITLAPFCIQRRFGVKVLESIPIHYGDKYEFIIDRNYRDNKTLFDYVFKEISKSNLYSAIVINQIGKSSKIFSQLENNEFLKKSLVTCPVSMLKDLTYDEFLSKLKSKVRSNFRSRLRKLNKLGELTFEINSDSSFYRNNQVEFRLIYEKRWDNIDIKLPNDVFYKCREESFCELLDRKIAYNIVLRLDDKIIGYRLGFLHENTYCDWKICYDTDYRKYGLGAIMTAKLIEKLIGEKVEALNHGAGGYSYKTDWTPSNEYTENFKFVKQTNFHLGKLLVNYEIKYKDLLKKYLKK